MAHVSAALAREESTVVKDRQPTPPHRRGMAIDAEFCPVEVADPFDTVEWELRSAQIKG